MNIYKKNMLLSFAALAVAGMQSRVEAGEQEQKTFAQLRAEYEALRDKGYTPRARGTWERSMQRLLNEITSIAADPQDSDSSTKMYQDAAKELADWEKTGRRMNTAAVISALVSALSYGASKTSWAQ